MVVGDIGEGKRHLDLRPAGHEGASDQNAEGKRHRFFTIEGSIRIITGVFGRRYLFHRAIMPSSGATASK